MTHRIGQSTPSNFSNWDRAHEFGVFSSGVLVSIDVDIGYGVHPVLKSDTQEELIKNQKLELENKKNKL